MKKIIFAIVLGVFFASAASASAASFVLSPAGGTYGVGDTITTKVVVDAEGTAINAVSGTVSFPSNLLKLTGISKAGSIVNFWTVDPTSDSSSAHYEGVVLNPGYSGSRGTIVTLTFLVRAPGTAVLTYRSAAILANDGLGTNVLDGTEGATFILSGAKKPDEPEVVPTKPVASLLPIITSSTHPDQTGWYKNNTPVISWNMPDDVVGVALLIDQKTETNPGTHSHGRMTSYTVAPLTDGVWYAHVRFLTKAGWGGVSHYRLGIDTVPPSELSVSETKDDDTSTGLFTLVSSDAGSGVDHYTFIVDDGEPVTVPAAPSWQSGVLSPGDHVLSAEVFDKAGNSLKVLYPFITTGVSAPVIDTYPKTLHSGDPLTVAGHTYPNTTVTLSIKETLESSYSFGTLRYRTDADALTVKQNVTSDDKGLFTMTLDNPVESGVYTVSAVAKLGDYESAPSASVTTVVSASFWGRVRAFIMRFFDFLIPLILALVIIAIIVWRMTKRYYAYRRKMESEFVSLDNKIIGEAEALTKAPDGGAGAQRELEFLQKMDAEVRSTVERTSYRAYRKNQDQ